MSAKIAFGMFDWVDRGPNSVGDLYESRLKLIESADKAGFYGYHLAEHHSTPLGMAPSPSVFFAALAQRTKHIRFSPMAYLLPMYHPLRLIEDWYHSITQLWHQHNDHAYDDFFAWEPCLAGETILIGSIDTVRDQIQQLVSESGINYFVGSFAWGSLRPEDSQSSFDLFTSHIAPHIH